MLYIVHHTLFQQLCHLSFTWKIIYFTEGTATHTDTLLYQIKQKKKSNLHLQLS